METGTLGEQISPWGAELFRLVLVLGSLLFVATVAWIATNPVSVSI